MLALYPDPNSGTPNVLSNNLAQIYSAPDNYRKYVVRFDQKIGDKDTLSGFWTGWKTDSSYPVATERLYFRAPGYPAFLAMATLGHPGSDARAAAESANSAPEMMRLVKIRRLIAHAVSLDGVPLSMQSGGSAIAERRGRRG